MEAGAKIINDITGMRAEKMRGVAADEKTEVVIMHMQGAPKTMQNAPQYTDVIKEIKGFFLKQIDLCKKSGINNKKIIVDPGIGFGKTTQHNLDILRNIEKFKLGNRLLIGASRKSFIGKILQGEEHPLPPEERLGGSLAIAAYCQAPP